MKASAGDRLPTAALRLATSASASPEASPVSRTAMGALQAGVLRRERPGSPNTRCASFGNAARSWYTKVLPVPPKPSSRSLM